MKIQILGSGCPSCKSLEKSAREAIESLGIEAEISKVTDMNEIIDMGVMMTPGLVVDGAVKSSGKVLTSPQVVEILESLQEG